MSKYLNLERLQYYHEKLAGSIDAKFNDYKEKLVVVSEIEPDDDINRVWVNAGSLGEVELITTSDFDSFSENLITTSESAPTSRYNKLWIQPASELIAIPTMEDIEGVMETVQNNSIQYIQDYLYSITFTNIDWEFGNAFLKERYTNSIGSCSSVRKGNYYGRNYDWYYDETAYFIIRVAKSKDVKYSSVGMTGGFPSLTDAFVKSGGYSEIYKVLPFITLDGINEKGVVANINVVPTGDMGITTGTVPTSTKEFEICVMSIVRYILDNFATATEAVNYLKQHVSVYAPNKTDGLKQELHVMVADKDKTYLIEFISNEMVITDMNTSLGGRTYMTNFYLQGTTVDSNNHINFNSVTPYGSGLERYNVISDNINTVNSVETMTALMQKIKYTNAYQTSTNPIWKTEFVDKEHNLTVTTDISQFMDIITRAREGYPNRQRNGIFWQTCHNTVYDIPNKLMYLIVQEQTVGTQSKVDISESIDRESLVGKKTPEGGEIFNDYINNKATAPYSTARGQNTQATEYEAYSEGRNSLASGVGSHAEGVDTTDTRGNQVKTTASGLGSHAEGMGTKATNDGAHSEGIKTTASGVASHAGGEETNAVGKDSFATGYKTNAVADGSFATGNNNTVAQTGVNGFVEGSNNTVTGANAHASGVGNQAVSANQFVMGSYAKPDATGNYALIIGNGTGTSARSNAFAVGKDGKIYVNNSTVGITLQNSQDVTLEQYLAMTAEQQNNGTYWHIIES